MSPAAPVPDINLPIAPGVLPGVLRQLYVERRSGDLVMLEGAHRTRFRIVRGHLVHAESSDPKLHFGSLLLESEQVSRESFEFASAVVRSGRARLGEALVTMSFLDPEEVDGGLALHAQRVLQQALGWRFGHLAFVAEDPDPSDPYDRPLPQSTAELVAAAARDLPAETIEWHLGDARRVLVPVMDPLVRFQRTNLTAFDGFVFSRVDGTLSLRDVVDSTALPAEEVRRSLFLLLCVGMLEFAREAAPAPAPGSAQFLRSEIEALWGELRHRDHFAALGVGRDATAAEIKAAYYGLAKRYHPDIHHNPALGDLGAKLGDIFSRLVEAHRVLSDDQLRGRYQESLDRLQRAPGASPGRATSAATVAPGSAPPPIEPAPAVAPDPAGMYQRAQERFDEGRYWEAIATLGEMLEVATGGLRTRGRLLLARAHLKHPDTEREAERGLLAATREDPENAEAFALLGGLYARRGMGVRAATLLRRALELNPRHKTARADLAAAEAAAKTP